MVTRRGFVGNLAGLAGLTQVWTESAFAQRALVGDHWDPDTVWLNANENPDGPPKAALDAIAKVLPESWRYHFPEFRAFEASFARSERLEPEQLIAGSGSNDVLNAAVAAFTSGSRPLITAEPTFEAPGETVKALGRPWIGTTLTETWEADVKRMAAEAVKAGGGLIYLCNPNNPTSSMTPKENIGWLVANVPGNTVILIDEAYLHFVEDWEKTSSMDLVRQGKNVVVTRTFSKIYGMAGIRAGFACGRPDLIQQMRPFRRNAMSILSIRATLAAVAEGPRFIPERRARLIRERTALCEWARQKKLRYIEPYANFVMFDTGRDAKDLGLDLLKKKVAVGRPFPALPKMLRVTVGTTEDMAKFRSAFEEVYWA
jgi:histidinol-phosphate aminotransferase